MNPSVPMLIITGPVGVGKTTVAYALSDLLNDLGKPHAIVDQDCLRHCYPGSPDDPFYAALGLRNLAAIWVNFRAVGAERLILVDVVEKHEAREDYQRAIPGAAIQIVRLTASLPTLRRRLEQRETGSSLIWHQNRAAELIALMDERRVEDILVETENRAVNEIAQEILDRARWA